MAMNPRLLRPTREPLLLDFAPGAAAAYSLRQLSSGYAGPVVTVRRSSDDVEDSFTSKEVSDGTLAAFCGAGDGFVKTWHSQTGTADVTQATDSRQPQIVDDGVVTTSNGKPSIKLDGTDDFLTGSLAVSTLGLSFAVLYQLTASAASKRVFAIGNSTFTTSQLSAFTGATNYGSGYRFPENEPTSGAAVSTEPMLLTYIRNSTALQTAYYLSVPYTNTNGTTSFTSTTIEIGRNGSDATCFPGYVMELIIYPYDFSSQRQRIEGNMAWSYS
jgi:hypothetical protein